VVAENPEETGQVAIVQGAVGDPCEDGLDAAAVVVVLSRVVGEDASDAAAPHLQERRRRRVGPPTAP
jgi:hypothetical protein